MVSLNEFWIPKTTLILIPHPPTSPKIWGFESFGRFFVFPCKRHSWICLTPWPIWFTIGAQGWKRLPHMRVPIFTDAECWNESSSTSSSKLQVWALLLKYSQKINLPLDFSVDSTESLGNKNKPCRKEDSFSTASEEGSLIATGHVDIQQDKCTYRGRPSEPLCPGC